MESRKKFRVTIEEYYNKDIIIEAEDEYDAWDKVEKLYKDGKIVLDHDDFSFGELYESVEAEEKDILTKLEDEE